MAIDLKAIAAKFTGTPEQQQANALESANYQAWRSEANAMETAYYERMMTARNAGDEALAQAIAAEFRAQRNVIEEKYGVA